MTIRALVLLLVLVAGVTATLLAAPFAQSPDYPQFADQGITLQLPHGMDVLSNLAFLLAGISGWIRLRRVALMDHRLQNWVRGYAISLIAIALGSAFYHLEPGNDTLVWDRLPMVVTFSLFFSLILASHLSIVLAQKLLPVLLLSGVGSTLYWYQTELSGAGDLRFYAAFQFLGLGMVVLILLMFPARHLSKSMLVLTVAWYVLAKLLELLDRDIYAATELISGHTLKHLASALGAWCVILSAPLRCASVHPPAFPECGTAQ